jgi:hypothetical protein
MKQCVTFTETMATYSNNNIHPFQKKGEDNLSMTNRWIKSLLDNLDENLDQQTRVKVLENCGRNCCRSSGFYRKAQDNMSKARGTNEFLDMLGKDWTHLKREGENIYVVYDRCYCPLGRALLKDYPGQLSSYRNCSRGWIMEMFVCFEKTC